ncbi:MAG: HYR domain-containing protein [Saprospiraceae bacterium]|nr:HYR domain-containing protein [Candidatus Vicinibacter affinis]
MVVSYKDDTLYHQSCSLRVIRTWIATDPVQSNLTASCEQIINLKDDQAPSITCPANITVQSGPDCTGSAFWSDPSTSDNCSSVRLSGSHGNGTSGFPIGVTNIYYTAFDACGNSANCSFTVTVEANCCNKPPVITCPADFYNCPQGIDPQVTGQATAVPGQAGCPQPVISYKDDTLYHQSCSLRVIRTWIATDPVQSNLTASCEQIINLKDDQAPSITCPANITVQSGPDCTGSAFWSDPSTSDNCSSVRLSGSHGNGTSGFPIGVTNIYYTAFDACGNSANCSFTVTVEANCCNKPPVITCPADFYNCPQGIDPQVTGQATAVPGLAGCPQPVISYKDDTLYHQSCSLRVIRTWIATDPVQHNLTASCEQIINLKDDQAPSITCPANITVQSGPDCTGTATWNDPSTSDNCSAVTLSGSHGNGSSGFPIGVTNIFYTAFDACGNFSNCSFTVTVEANCCNKPPVISCPADFYNCPQGIDPQVTGQATATPGTPQCPDPILSYKDDTLFNQSCSLKVIRTWTAIDPLQSNLVTKCDQIIELKDEMSPSISCPPDITVQSGLDCKAVVNWNEPSTSDNCSNVILSSSHQSGSTFDIGNTLVVYTATDACGHSSSCSFNITVNENCCNKPPVLSCPRDFEACPGSAEPSRTGQASAQKGHPTCGEPLISFKDQILFQQACSLLIIRTWYATDPDKSELKDSCQQYIDLKDDQAPIISDCPVDITIDPNYNCEAFPTWVIPPAFDNCTLASINGTHRPGEIMPSGKTTVVYTATDACGLTSTCSFVVTVTENCCNRPPVMVCPDNYVACPGTATDTSVTGVPTVTAGKSSCLNPIVSYHENVISRGPCNGAIIIERTWRAVDPNLSNLFAECTQRIELKDNVAPRFTSTPSNITVDAQGDCEVPVNWLAPVATDNCGLASLTTNIPSGSNFTEGTTSVTYTATDQCGNTSSTTFTVTVKGTVIGINCPNDTIVFRTNPYLNGAYVNWPLPHVNYCNPCQGSINGFIYMGEYNGSRYFCSKGPENWETAKIICDINGGKLAVINDHDENQFVASKLAGQTAWIGGSDARSEGRFDWIDNSPFIYSNWLPGQPNNFGPNEDFIELAPDGTWNDQNGDESREFVLEMPCYELKQIKGPKRGGLVNCGTNTISYVATKDGQSDTCSFVVRVNCDSLTTYCNNKAQFSNLMWIKKVKIADIDNTSGNDNGYRFFNNPCGNLKAGETYSLCVTPGYLTNSYNVYWKIWIDYNADGVFHNITELVTYGYGNTTMCANLRMPGGFVRANVRMRVAMSYGAYPADPCSPILYGEIEDYCFNLLPPTNFGGGTSESLEIQSTELKCAENCESQSPVELDLRSVEQDLFGSHGEFFIIPNPANSEVILKTIADKAKSMVIFDAQGKNVWKKIQPSTEAETINTSNWAQGLYHITVEFKNGHKTSKRFVVQH